MQQTIKYDKHDRINAVSIYRLSLSRIQYSNTCIYFSVRSTVPYGTREDTYKNTSLISLLITLLVLVVKSIPCQ